LLEHLGAGEHAGFVEPFSVSLERAHSRREALGTKLFGGRLWIME
jgi:hypothetical protein